MWFFFFVLEKNCRRNVDEEDPNGNELSSLLNDQNDVENENWNEGVQSFMIFIGIISTSNYRSIYGVKHYLINQTIHFILK